MMIFIQNNQCPIDNWTKKEMEENNYSVASAKKILNILEHESNWNSNELWIETISLAYFIMGSHQYDDQTIGLFKTFFRPFIMDFNKNNYQ